MFIDRVIFNEIQKFLYIFVSIGFFISSTGSEKKNFIYV